MHNIILAKLTAKDDPASCAFMERIVSESQTESLWYRYFEDFASLLDHPKSLVRNRALRLLAAALPAAGAQHEHLESEHIRAKETPIFRRGSFVEYMVETVRGHRAKRRHNGEGFHEQAS